MLTSEQIEQRLNYITGTDAPIILGVSKYCTPYQLWEYKTRRAIPEDIGHKPHVRAGIMLEPVIRQWLSEEIGKEIYHDNEFRTSERYGFLGGTIDGSLAEGNVLVEIKTASSESEWGESGSQTIPKAYQIQVAHYMALCEADCCYIGVLIRGVDFRSYCIQRNLELESFLMAREKEFWDCVQADIPPEPSNTHDIVRMFEGKCSDSKKVADISLEAHVLHYKELRDQIKHLEDAEERVKLEICKGMGEHNTLVDKGGRVLVTWNKPKDTIRFDSKKFSLEHPDFYKKYLYNTETSRRFLVK